MERETYPVPLTDRARARIAALENQFDELGEGAYRRGESGHPAAVAGLARAAVA